MSDPGSAKGPPTYAPPEVPSDEERQRAKVCAIRICGRVKVHRDDVGLAFLEGVGTPRYVVELGVAGRESGKRGPLRDWTVYAHLRNAHGDWIVDKLDFRCDGKRAEPSERLRAAVSPERWRESVEFELRQRLAFDELWARWGETLERSARDSGASRSELREIRKTIDAHRPDDAIRKIVFHDWNIGPPRSPRGPLPKFSPESKRANASTLRSRRRRLRQRAI